MKGRTNKISEHLEIKLYILLSDKIVKSERFDA